MDAVEYFKVKKRMCNSVGNCYNCPLQNMENECFMNELKSPELSVAEVAQWGREHPLKTNRMKFAEVFGRSLSCNINLDRDGRAFVIEGDIIGTVMQEDWLDLPYVEVKNEAEEEPAI